MPGKIYTSILQPNQSLIDLRNHEDTQNIPIPDAFILSLFTKQQEQHLKKYGPAEKKSVIWLHEAGKKIESFLQQHPDLNEIVLLCRDGRWLSRFGWDIARLHRNSLVFQNGMKGLKRWMKKKFSEHHNYFVLTGQTGSGKTEVLNTCKDAFGIDCIDLELLAKHNGSVFGNINGQVQPTQFSFEFSLAKLLTEITVDTPVLIEYEPGNLGALHVPIPMMQQIEKGCRILLQRSMDRRIGVLVQQYAGKNDEIIKNGIQNISMRLGDTLTNELCHKLAEGKYEEVAKELLLHYDRREQYRNLGTHALLVNTDNPDQAAQTIVQYMQKKRHR